MIKDNRPKSKKLFKRMTNRVTYVDVKCYLIIRGSMTDNVEVRHAIYWGSKKGKECEIIGVIQPIGNKDMGKVSGEKEKLY